MLTLTDILQASEIALSLGRQNGWPAGSLKQMNTSSGVLLNGHTLAEVETQVVKASNSVKAGQNECVHTYQSFMMAGTPITLANIGTQPYSTTLADNNLLYAEGPAASKSRINVDLWREANGILMSNKNNEGNVALGAAENANYATVRRRGLRYIIVNICGAGGGGGRAAGAVNGWGAGSGSVAAVIIDMLPFTSAHRLSIQIPGGGDPGNWDGDKRDNGDDANTLVLMSTSPTATGQIEICGGQGGKSAGTGVNGQGMGGGAPIITGTGDGSLRSKVGFLVSENGVSAPGTSGSSARYDPGMLPAYNYIDPNPSEISISTSQSFNNGSVGSGGAGGFWKGSGAAQNGHRGKPGAIRIYY